MPDDELIPPPTPAALGPGDDDPRSPARGVAARVAPPPAPGDLVGDDTTAGVQVLTLPPPTPGATPVTRSIVRIPLPVTPADE